MAAAVTLIIITPEIAAAANIQVVPSKDSSPAGIILSGDIVSGDVEKFSRIAANNPNAVIFLDSNGGEIVPAMDIGKIVRLREYSTSVYKGSSCASACALVWLAGSRRVVYNEGRVGFHASYKDVGGKLIEVGVGNALVGHYLSQLGYDQRAVIFVTSTPPEKISWLSDTTQIDSGISFETFKADDDQKEISAVPELSELMDGSEKNKTRAALDSKSNTGRNVQFFANELSKSGYKAEIDATETKSPQIITGVDGYKILLSFSSCVKMDCNYLEILGYWSDISQISANKAFKEFALDENFSSLVYQKTSSSMVVYHYIIIGTDGISPKNLMENLEYFSRDFEKVGKIMNDTKQ